MNSETKIFSAEKIEEYKTGRSRQIANWHTEQLKALRVLKKESPITYERRLENLNLLLEGKYKDMRITAMRMGGITPEKPVSIKRIPPLIFTRVEPKDDFKFNLPKKPVPVVVKE